MKTFSIKFLGFFVLSLCLFSCGGDQIDYKNPVKQSEGLRLKYFPSTQAMGSELTSFVKPGFELTKGSEIRGFGNYEKGFGAYEYRSTWMEVTPLNPGKYEEWISVEGVPQGWDINDDHEQTTKAELLQSQDRYDEVIDERLAKASYKDHIIVLKNKSNKKGSWQFLAFIDPTHRIDGDGQRAVFSGGFQPLTSADKAKYNVPTDEMAASVFIKLVEPTKNK